MHKLWARRKRGWEPTPPLSPPPALPASGGKVAICLTVVDALPHEGLWRRWLAGAASDPHGRSGEVFIHAKVRKRGTAWWPCGQAGGPRATQRLALRRRGG